MEFIKKQTIYHYKKVDELIGKKAYKTRGIFSGLVGYIHKSESEITPYKLVFEGVGSVGFMDIKDIILVEDD